MNEPFTTVVNPVASHATGAEAIDTITLRVIQVLQNIRSEEVVPGVIAVDSRLADIGFTSVDMVKVMLGIEAEFDLMIPQPEITPENFVSAASIAAMLCRIGGPWPAIGQD